MKRFSLFILVGVLIVLSATLGLQSISAQEEQISPNRSTLFADHAHSNVVTLSGWFHVIWKDNLASPQKTTVEYVLIDDQGQWTSVLLDENFAAPLSLNRKRVQITGNFVTGPHQEIEVHSLQVKRHDSAGDSVVEATAPTISGSLPWVTILCRFTDSADVTPRDRSWFEGLMGSEFPGMDHYWREVSYGNINLTGSAVAGWYDLPHPRSYYVDDVNGNGTVDPEDRLKAQLVLDDCTGVADTDVFFPDFAGMNLVFNDAYGCCAMGGSTTLLRDGETKTYGVTWMPKDLEYGGWEDQSVLAHEMGHAFGLPHSSGNYDYAYDSKWDVMSHSQRPCSPRPEYGCNGVHTISYHKDLLGWIAPGRKYVATPGSSATIILERLGQPMTESDYLMAEIPLGNSSTRFYTVEARRFIGYDDNVPGDAIIIHEVDRNREPYDGDYRPALVVDIDNDGDPNDAGAMWLPGETFTDTTFGITVTVEANTESGFAITINVAPVPSFVDCQSQTQIPEAECEALVALYSSTNGSAWAENWGWLGEPWPCSWHGISCSDSSVIAIDLSENQLRGSIPPELAELLYLQRLNLASNQLNGNIPPELGTLQNLKELLLSVNELSGSIPSGLGSLTTLEHLYLNDNELVGSIPSELGNLTSLRWLALARNQLSGELPAEMGNLAELEGLILWNNQLSGDIPAELGDLTELQYLDLCSNDMSGSIPSGLGRLTSLQGLYLCGNELTGNIPAEVGNLTALRHLLVDWNMLSGTVPDELGNLISLRRLYLNNNRLRGSLPLGLINLNLEALWFTDTVLCEPDDAVFQAWLTSIPDLKRTGVTCGTEFLFLPIVTH